MQTRRQARVPSVAAPSNPLPSSANSEISGMQLDDHATELDSSPQQNEKLPGYMGPTTRSKAKQQPKVRPADKKTIERKPSGSLKSTTSNEKSSQLPRSSTKIPTRKTSVKAASKNSQNSESKGDSTPSPVQKNQKVSISTPPAPEISVQTPQVTQKSGKTVTFKNTPISASKPPAVPLLFPIKPTLKQSLAYHPYQPPTQHLTRTGLKGAARTKRKQPKTEKQAPPEDEFNNESLADILNSTRSEELDAKVIARAPAKAVRVPGRNTSVFESSRSRLYQPTEASLRRATTFTRRETRGMEDVSLKRASLYGGAVRVIRKPVTEEIPQPPNPEQLKLAKLESRMEEFFAKKKKANAQNPVEVLAQVVNAEQPQMTPSKIEKPALLGTPFKVLPGKGVPVEKEKYGTPLKLALQRNMITSDVAGKATSLTDKLKAAATQSHSAQTKETDEVREVAKEESDATVINAPPTESKQQPTDQLEIKPKRGKHAKFVETHEIRTRSKSTKVSNPDSHSEDERLSEKDSAHEETIPVIAFNPLPDASEILPSTPIFKETEINPDSGNENEPKEVSPSGVSIVANETTVDKEEYNITDAPQTGEITEIEVVNEVIDSEKTDQKENVSNESEKENEKEIAASVFNIPRIEENKITLPSLSELLHKVQLNEPTVKQPEIPILPLSSAVGKAQQSTNSIIEKTEMIKLKPRCVRRPWESVALGHAGEVELVDGVLAE